VALSQGEHGALGIICLEPAYEALIRRITATRSALLYLQVPGAANQVRDVRKVALVSL